jgi:uncharacterized protein (TIGR00162 family)
MDWQLKPVAKIPKLNEPILIEGLPGIGNVGKIAVDFMIDTLKAKKLYDFFSYSLPHSVFIKEDSTVELPKLEIYHKKVKNRDVLLLCGDVQPVTEHGCYSFCSTVLDLAKSFGCKEIVTIGGIGLEKPPEGEPKVYCAGNNNVLIQEFAAKAKVNAKSYGVVGPIIGVTGVLVGMSKEIPAVALLAQTYAHPLYLGIRGARSVVKAIEDKYNLGIEIDKLDEEIKGVESEVLKRTKELRDVSKKNSGNLNYIG